MFAVSDLSVRWVARGDAEIEAHDLPGSTLIQDDVLWTKVTVYHLHSTVQKGQALRDLWGGQEKKEKQRV